MFPTTKNGGRVTFQKKFLLISIENIINSIFVVTKTLHYRYLQFKWKSRVIFRESCLLLFACLLQVAYYPLRFLWWGTRWKCYFLRKSSKKVEKIENLSKIDLKKSNFSTYFSIFCKSEHGIVFSTTKNGSRDTFQKNFFRNSPRIVTP